MNKIVYDINQMIAEAWDCYNRKRYLSSLMITLTLPDICSKIEFNTKQSSQEQYVKWCNKWMYIYFGGILPNFTNNYKEKIGEIIYQLRCSLFHNGENNTSKFNSEIFNINKFTLFIDKEKSIDSNSIIAKNELVTGLFENKNEFDLKVNYEYLIFSILQSVLLFMDKTKNVENKFPKIDIEII